MNRTYIACGYGGLKSLLYGNFLPISPLMGGYNYLDSGSCSGKKIKSYKHDPHRKNRNKMIKKSKKQNRKGWLRCWKSTGSGIACENVFSSVSLSQVRKKLYWNWKA